MGKGVVVKNFTLVARELLELGSPLDKRTLALVVVAYIFFLMLHKSRRTF